MEEGGVPRAVLDLCAVLADRGHEVSVLTLDDAEVPQQWTNDASNVPRVERLARSFGVLPRLGRAALRRFGQHLAQADVLHLHVPWDPVCMQLARVARRRGVPYLISLHGMLDDWCMAQKDLKKRLYLAATGRRLLERAHAVHCTAGAEKDQSEKWYPRGRSVVLPLIFDPAPFEVLPGPELARRAFPGAFDGKATVLFVGRLHPVKRIDLLIESATLLRDDGLAWKVLIAGRGQPPYERTLRRLVEQRQLSECVEFLGFVSGREKVSLYQAADVFVLPSHHENWGFVALEALACATPVVMTRAVNIWPELEASGGTMLVEPSAEAAAQAVRRLVTDQAGLAAMGRRGRAWVLDTLSPGRVVGQYEQLYESL